MKRVFIMAVAGRMALIMGCASPKPIGEAKMDQAYDEIVGKY